MVLFLKTLIIITEDKIHMTEKHKTTSSFK